MARFIIEIEDEKVLKMLTECIKSSNTHIVTPEEPSKETPKENTSLSDINKVKTLNKVETAEERADTEKLLSECQKILIEAVKAGKRDLVKTTFTKLGIVSLSTADGGQLIEFKKVMNDEK